MRLVVCFHAESCHVIFRAAFGQSGQNRDALRQADDLLVQLPGLLVGAASRGPAGAPSSRVEELEASYAVLAGRVEDKPVFLPFLKKETK